MVLTSRSFNPESTARISKFLEERFFSLYQHIQSTGLCSQDTDNITLRNSKTIIKTLITSTAGCCFFTATTGHISHLVSDHGALLGDQAVLLRGPRMPPSLRKENVQFRLIGRCV
jgi:hypothetical protein